MKKILLLLLSIFMLSGLIFFLPKINAQNTSCDISNVQSVCGGTNGFGSACQDLLSQCSTSINQALQQSINATTPLESQLNSLQTQIEGLKSSLTSIQTDLTLKKTQIDQGYTDIAKKEVVLDKAISDYYIKSYYNSPLLVLLSAQSASQLTQILAYQRAATNQDKEIITNIALSIQDLEVKKASLEDEQTKLTALKSSLDQQSAQLDSIVSKAKDYQQTLSTQLSELNSIQQSIIAAKLAGLHIPLTAYAGLGGGCSSDISPYKDPGFSGTKFGFFTYGVPNRVGLNQYGALGRANAGQGYNDILNAYYTNFQIQNLGNPNITVSGTNDYGETVNQSWDLETYLQHVYEVPAGWPSEALKAQAIAARSYVMAFTNNGANSICADQHCQEVKLTPHDNPCDGWCQAVKDTAGQVMVSGGSPIKAWFSSTHGGYVHSSADIGWSATSYTKTAQDASSNIGSFSDLQNNAYDKSSPWFYCDWGSRSSYNGTAWLQSSEVADIVNAILLAQKDSGTVNHLYQTDKPNPAGTDTWDPSRVRQELQNRGITPYNSINSVSVSADFGSGQVTTVNVSGDAGNTSINGSDFKNYFDLRAPSNIQIVGPLFNIEQR
jgi:SpoIID/LytB domain protein